MLQGVSIYLNAYDITLSFLMHYSFDEFDPDAEAAEKSKAEPSLRITNPISGVFDKFLGPYVKLERLLNCALSRALSHSLFLFSPTSLFVSKS